MIVGFDHAVVLIGDIVAKFKIIVNGERRWGREVISRYTNKGKNI